MLRLQLSRYKHVRQSVENIYANHAKSVGLTYMNFLVLAFIYHFEEPCTQKDICAHYRYNKQAVNTIIKGYERQGIVHLLEAESDRRIKYITFTEDGKRYADEVMCPISSLEKKALSSVSSEEMAFFIDVLERIYAAFKPAQENSPN